MSDVILVSIADGVATITLNRPERQNAWVPAMTDRYTAALDDCACDPAVRAIVVTGAGGHWCSGGDGAVLDDIAGGDAPDISYQRLPPYLALHIAKPVIAAIPGVCFGIGMFHALCCDIRFAAADVKFSTAYARRGLPAEAGMSWLLPRAIGHGQAADLLFSARVVRAEEAARIGLVSRVVAPDELLDEAIGYARGIATQSAPTSLRMMKEQLHRDWSGDFVAAFDRAEAMLKTATASADFREGVLSWQEKRSPAFSPVGGEDGGRIASSRC